MINKKKRYGGTKQIRYSIRPQNEFYHIHMSYRNMVRYYVRTSVSANVMTETCHAPKYWKMTLHLLKLLLTFGRCILRPSGQYVLFLSIKSYTCVSKVEKT